MASQMPDRPIIQKTGQPHRNSKRGGRAAPRIVHEHNPHAAIPKTEYFRSPDMMVAVRTFPCGRCGKTIEGTCGAHPNWSWADKGGRIKAHDLVAAMCPSDHYAIDQGKELTGEEREMIWLKAFYNTMLHGFRVGKFVVTA